MHAAYVCVNLPTEAVLWCSCCAPCAASNRLLGEQATHCTALKLLIALLSFCLSCCPHCTMLRLILTGLQKPSFWRCSSICRCCCCMAKGRCKHVAGSTFAEVFILANYDRFKPINQSIILRHHDQLKTAAVCYCGCCCCCCCCIYYHQQ